MPRWSLNMLLRFLQGPLFEPLESASFLRLTQKTLVLLLLASGRRIADMDNLSRVSIPDLSGYSWSLLWVSGYVPKNRSPAFEPLPPSISRVQSAARVDILLCPVRSLQVYLHRTGALLDDIPLSQHHRYL